MLKGIISTTMLYLLHILFWSLGSPVFANTHHYHDLSGFSSGSTTFFNLWQLKTPSSNTSLTEYQLIADDRFGYIIEARARDSMAGLYRELSLDPLTYPYLDWSWKISNPIEGARLDDKQRDDAAARIIISFGRDLLKGGIPKGSLCYVWAAHEDREALITNPYSSEIKVIVVESGSENEGKWQYYRRNLIEDYQRAFGEAPGIIRAVTIISDTDNTGSETKAWYGPIGLTNQPAKIPDASD